MFALILRSFPNGMSRCYHPIRMYGAGAINKDVEKHEADRPSFHGKIKCRRGACRARRGARILKRHLPPSTGRVVRQTQGSRWRCDRVVFRTGRATSAGERIESRRSGAGEALAGRASGLNRTTGHRLETQGAEGQKRRHCCSRLPAIRISVPCIHSTASRC